MKVGVRAELEFEMDERFEWLVEICSFCYNRGYIKTTCNNFNEKIFSNFGYRKKQQVLLHRLLYQLYIGRKLGADEFVDHINHNKLDNRIENLRILTNSQNSKNHKLREGQIYHNIYYIKYVNYFKFEHREAGIQRCFRTLHQALEFFQIYDKENDHVLTRSIHNLKPIEEIEDIVLEPNEFCDRCGLVLWNQYTLKRHQKKCTEVIND